MENKGLPEDALVTPVYEREPDSVPGPFYVIKERCVLCGYPPAMAEGNVAWSEETFRRSCGGACPDHCRVEKQPETTEELALMIDAACGSCVEAIRYCGTNPEILTRFTELGYKRLCDALLHRGNSDVEPR